MKYLQVNSTEIRDCDVWDVEVFTGLLIDRGTATLSCTDHTGYEQAFFSLILNMVKGPVSPDRSWCT